MIAATPSHSGRPHRSASPETFNWPGALEIDGRALAALPEPERPRGRGAAGRAPRRSRQPGPTSCPCSPIPSRRCALYVGRLLARAGRSDRARRGRRLADHARAAVGRPHPRASTSCRTRPTLTPAARQAIEQAIRDRDAPVRMRALEALERHDPLALAPGRAGRARRRQPRGAPAAALVIAGVPATADAPEAARLATLPLLERLDDADR